MEQPPDAGRQWFGNILGTLRMQREISLRDVSKVVDSSPSALALYFKGDRLPPEDLIPSLARALDADMEDLYSKWRHARATDESASGRPTSTSRGSRLMGARDVRTSAEAAQLIEDDSYAVLWLESLVMVKTPEIVVTVALSKFDLSRLGLSCSTTEELARSIVSLANEPVSDDDS